jgi:hypothetical protein
MFKVGDGMTEWASLPYMKGDPGDLSGLQDAIDAEKTRAEGAEGDLQDAIDAAAASVASAAGAADDQIWNAVNRILEEMADISPDFISMENNDYIKTQAGDNMYLENYYD